MMVNKTKTSLKQAVILAGGQKTNLAPISGYTPTWMFPILNKPLIQHTTDFLKQNGIKDIMISLPAGEKISGLLKHYVSSTVPIEYHEEDRPRGTAGALKDIENFFDGPFLVINSNLFIGHFDISGFIQYHIEKDSKATIGIYSSKGNGSYEIDENVSLTEDKMIKKFHTMHSSMNTRSPWKFSGMYIFDPSVLKFIDETSYMDIKEQLIPLLQQADIKVPTYRIDKFHRSINSINDYIDVQRELLIQRSPASAEGVEEIAQDVWVGNDVKISPRAYLLGPVLIGDGCRIGEGAQIIGPSVIGKRCLISEGTVVRESMLWDGASLSDGVRIEYSVVYESSKIHDHCHIKSMIVLNGKKIRDSNLIPSNYNIEGIFSTRISTQKANKVIKRIMDITLSAAGLVLLLPVFSVIAIAIKADSRGPVFYIQKRCGIGGKLFNMWKFRTMVANAENLHKELSSRKETDGPMFKMSQDPRVTRLGRVLRRTSLDEIPQLINVLKGEMSLVGPRPLIMEEMKFSPSWRDTRLRVKPGITGLWQIQGRSKASFHDWIRHDVHYVKNQSLWFDIKILLKTIKVVFKKIGAY